MKTRILIVTLSASIAAVVACSNNDTKSIDAAKTIDAHVVDAKPADAAKVFMDAPPGTFPLTVKNFDGWCTVKMNGTVVGASVNVLPGTVSLVATANQGPPQFELGTTPWHDVDGDTGAGVQGALAGSGPTESSTAMVTVGSAAKCVWVCCPFANTGSGCALPDQCTP